MDRQTTQQHQYSAHPPVSHRYTSAHSNSSAFSASAGPNEDWTKISDLAERRRIQNRIAQRNYRKKMKRKFEDLERRAASTSPEGPCDREEKKRCPTQHAAAPRRHRAHTLGVAAPSPQSRCSPPLSFQRSVSSYDGQAAYAHGRGDNARRHSPTPTPTPTPPTHTYSNFSTAEQTYPSSSYALSSSYSTTSSLPTMDPPPYSNSWHPRPSEPTTTTTPYYTPASHIKLEHYQGEPTTFAPAYIPARPRTAYTPTPTSPTLDDSCPSSILGSPLDDLWALYPTPPESVTSSTDDAVAGSSLFPLLMPVDGFGEGDGFFNAIAAQFEDDEVFFSSF